MRKIKGYDHRIKDAYRDEDGCWIILQDNWICPDDYYGEKTIHEDNWTDAINVLKRSKFVLKNY